MRANLGQSWVQVVQAMLGLAAIVAGSAQASFHLFRIHEIYSSPDGTVQFVELTESTGSNSESFWAGQTLTSIQGTTVRTLTFPSNLPSTATANRSVIVATPAFAAAAGITPDFVVPAPFLFPGGGTLNYAGVDIVTYGPLPTDGVSSIDRNGVAAVNTPTNFAGQTGAIAPPPPPPPPPVRAPAADIPVLGPSWLAVLAVLVAATAALTLRAGSSRRRPPRSSGIAPPAP